MSATSGPENRWPPAGSSPAGSSPAAPTPPIAPDPAATSTGLTTPTRPPGSPRGRQARLVVAAALAGVALALAALLPTWHTQTYGSDHSGRLQQAGSVAVPGLLPLALVAAAGLAAAYAARGWAGRLIGMVLAATGAGITAAAAVGWLRPPADLSGPAGPPAPSELIDPVTTSPVGPVLAGLGGLLIVLAGVAVVAGRAGRRLGRRFDARTRPSSTTNVNVNATATAPAAPTSGQVTDSDAADGWWKALDGGVDPTADGSRVVGLPPEGQLP